MKKILLFTIGVMLGVSVMAQLMPAKISKSLQNKMATTNKVSDLPNTFSQPGNAVVNTKAVLEEIIGASRYDMQSNASMMSRLYLYPDGSLSGTWTYGMIETSYTDRGSGYNYSDGTTWGAAPSARLETVRTGWPNINPWMGTGECNVSHNSTTSLVLNTRAVKGTGSWTQTLPLTSPTGITGLVWPRAITNGDNFQNIHIITVGQGSLGGQTAALLYYRSLDGGATWDKMAVVLPELDGTYFKAIGGDDYAWVEPHGDTIAFVACGGSTDAFLMCSYDNGNTWTRTIIMQNKYSLNPAGTATGDYIAGDGCIAGAMDKNGVFHVAFGRMTWANTGLNYYPGTDGLVYWNSTQPALDTNIIRNFDSCYVHDLLLGYVVTPNSAGDTIIAFPTYGVSVSSFPQITIDDYDNIYVLWQGLTVGNPSADPYNFCHVWGRAWLSDKAKWTEMIDFNTGLLYLFQEFSYPAVAKSLKNDKLQMITQVSSQPGSNIKDTAIPVHDVDIVYREIPTSEFIPVGIDNTAVIRKNAVGQNFPNPVKGTTTFTVNLEKQANVIVEVSNVMGQKVMTSDKGLVNAGARKYTIDCNSLTSGIYFYTVKINGESFTQKMIVE
ncbi:MAG: T9SS type A sorting domain-containing protein [Bacteroidota bacterium]